MYVLPMAASKLQMCSWVVSRLYGPQRLKYLISGLCRESLLTPREEGRPTGGRWKPEDWMIFKERSWDLLLCLHNLQLKPDDELCMIKEITQMIFCLQSKCDLEWNNCRLLGCSRVWKGWELSSSPAQPTCLSVCFLPLWSSEHILCARPSQKQCLICHDALGGENLKRAGICKEPCTFPLEMASLLQSFWGSSRKHSVPLSVFLMTEIHRTWSKIRHRVLESLSSVEGPRCFQCQRREAFSCIKVDALFVRFGNIVSESPLDLIKLRLLVNHWFPKAKWVDGQHWNHLDIVF